MSYPLVPIPGGRARLIELTLAFVLSACHLSGVTHIALVGSLTTAKPEPKDTDLIVTVLDEADLAPLAKLGRKLQGSAGSLGRGADIFLADIAGNYLGRICHWKDCRPFIRLSCDALHCGQRPYLHDDFGDIKLPKSLITNPPLQLYPQIVATVTLPSDIEQGLIIPLKEQNLNG